MAAKATALRRHPESRRLATLVATVRSPEAKAVDDALELFDVLMTNDLLARAARDSRNEKLRRDPRLAKDAGKLAAAVGVVLDALEHEQQLSLDLVWEAIESKVSRAELRAAVAHLMEVAPPADADPDGECGAARSSGGSRRFGRSWRCCARRSSSARPRRPPASSPR